MRSDATTESAETGSSNEALLPMIYSSLSFSSPTFSMSYVDGFVIAIPKKNLPAYRKMAALGGRLWKKYGALDYKECVMQDARPKWVVLTFPKLAKCKPGETVVFSYIVYRSRAHRDQVNAKVMKDPAMNDPKNKTMPMPFKMNRMAYGGFKVIVDTKKR